MKKLTVLFLFLSTICMAQKDSEAVLRLSITDLDGEALLTEVFFKSSNKEYSVQTDKNGKAEIFVQIDEAYRISISSSLTYFDYEIPDFPGQVYDLPLQYNVSDDIQNVPNVGNALLVLSVLNLPEGKKIEIIDMKTKSVISTITDKAHITLPVNNKYKIKISGVSIKNDILIVDETPYNALYYLLYISDSENATFLNSDGNGFFNVNYIDIYSKTPVSNEKICIKSKKIKKEYKGVTTQNGTCLIKVPLDDTYSLNITQENEIDFLDVKADDDIIQIFSWEIEYPSTKKYLEDKKTDSLRLAKRDSLFAAYKRIDSIMSAKNDSLLAAYKRIDSIRLAKSDSLFIISEREDSIRSARHDSLVAIYESKIPSRPYSLSGGFRKNNKENLKSQAEVEANKAKEEIKNDPAYFQKTNNVVCATLYRLRKKINSKMIVTDLTGSMNPYIGQILVWYYFNINQNQDNDYVFFNDGNRTADSKKKIGKTGGIYYTGSDNIDDIVNKITETMNNGSGGDGPENDIEALIFAQNKKKAHSEIILIADNYAPVRDIRLLSQLNVPIRIILCGTDWGINHQYVEIAYKTNGAIHTIEEDIMSFGNLKDGNTLTIGKSSFLFSKGKFFKK